MTKLNVVPPPPVDQVLYGIARAVALREWHRSPGIQSDFEHFWTANSDRFLREPEVITRGAMAPDVPSDASPR